MTFTISTCSRSITSAARAGDGGAPAVRAVMQRVQLVADKALVVPDAPRSGFVEVTTRDGRKVNHFTGAVDDIDAWVARMRGAGVGMKQDIEGAPGTALRQTATSAAPVTITLADGRTRSWPYAYFEIAQRSPGFDGFLGPQARALFDMTKRS